MPVILVAVALFFAFKPGLSDADRVQRMRPGVFAVTAVPLIAAYDGFFGPGTGSFFMLAFVMLAGFGVLKATAHTKLLNFASNIGSLAVFIPSGAIWWVVGLCMALAQVAGSAIGARAGDAGGFAADKAVAGGDIDGDGGAAFVAGVGLNCD